MRGFEAVAVVIAIAAAAMMFGMSGYGAIHDNDPSAGLGPMQEKLNSSSNNQSVERGVDGKISGQDPSLVSVAINASSLVANIIAFVLLLPISLEEIGLPYWMAWPLGVLGQLGGFIALAQFTVGRVLK